MTNHIHDLDDPRMCMKCAASRVTAAGVRDALHALGADTTAIPAILTDADLIPLLGRLTEHVAMIVKHRVDPVDEAECATFASGGTQQWAVQIAHTLLPATITAAGLLTLATTDKPVDPAAANTLGIAHMATGVCAEVARIHVGLKHHDVEEVDRMLRSLHEGLGTMIEHRLLTPPAGDGG